MMLPEFKTHLLLDGWTMDESTHFTKWFKDGIELQWDKGDTKLFEQMVFCTAPGKVNPTTKHRRMKTLSAYTSFQECIDDLE